MLINANILLSYYNIGMLEINNRKKFEKFTNNVEIITFLNAPGTMKKYKGNEI